MSSQPLILATRGSALALAQANTVLAECRRAVTDRSFDIRIFRTTGDKLQTASLAAIDLPKGLFTKELEVALLGREADLAVHSLKDLPTDLPDGLTLGAVGKRADARDVLVYRAAGRNTHRGFEDGLTLSVLPDGVTVATSSTRRAAQVRELKPGVSVIPIRGNVGTRLRKVAEDGSMDATLLAAAGLHRLGFRISEEGRISGGPPGSDSSTIEVLRAAYLSTEEMIPCVGQAAIGIETRANDDSMREICAALNHSPTQDCVLAERAFLNALGGGCQAAVAAFAEIVGDTLVLRAVSYLGGNPRRGEQRGPRSQAIELGVQLAAFLTA